MKIFLLLSALLAFALCQPDSSTLCIPEKISWVESDLTGDGVSTVKIDFGVKKSEYVKIDGSERLVKDFGTMTRYSIYPPTNDCKSTPLPPEEVIPMCLPAQATALGNLSVGYMPGGLSARAWDLPMGSFNVNMAFTFQPGGLIAPLAAKFHTGSRDMDFSIFFSNPTTNFSMAGAFDVPDPCPPASIV